LDANLPKPLAFKHAEYGMNIISEGQASGAPDANSYSNPIWTNDRELETCTTSSDGTIVQIGGEHEDFYDPDLMVYNQVIVFHRDVAGKLDIYGYPEAVFPKIDVHTATLVAGLNAIVVIADMSAPQVNRDIAANGGAPVYLLHLGRWKMEKRVTSGEGSGVIWKHVAELRDGVVRVSAAQSKYASDQTKRRVFKNEESEVVGVMDDEVWEMDVGTGRWTYGGGTEWATVGKKGKNGGRRR
jgi:hypothetical protein